MCSQISLLLFLAFIICVSSGPEENEGVKYANKCEVCKILATELENRLEETGKTNEVLEIGYSVDDVKPKKKSHYRKSELRLLESLDGICNKILDYNIHKERTDSTRFAKGMSQTFKTLHGLVNKGVKVELGIPHELWDKPSVEITDLKSQCEKVLEEYEEDIEHWYFHHQGIVSLKQYLCADKFLKDSHSECLKDELQGNKKGEMEILQKVGKDEL
ncbi:protein canopy 4 [Halyomorpha halys]|uniref:protein canopy 4 n=1 Tax=Halyomorpha halys TaxID=286706 RepID=UPI0006D4DF39|nr:protein canopy 4 [Halyomorpha halys]